MPKSDRPDIRLIALDLDGTLLTTDKQLSARNRMALQRASEQGVCIVPASGRIFSGLPGVILDLPFLKYSINSNGACLYDIANDSILYRAEIALPLALEIMSWLDDQPVIYDCYINDKGWMTAEMWDRIEQYAPNPIVVSYMKTIRNPVPDLKNFVRRQGVDVQKIQAFCIDDATQVRLLRELPFPRLAVSSSVPRNVEINREDATKGAALLALAEHLHIGRNQIMAFGDGLNDTSMIRDAGIGVAMENAIDEVKAAADIVAAGNDDDGVARVIEEYVLK